jgi:hypothetical protein
MLIKNLRFVVCALVISFWAASASAVVLYTDDFNSAGDSANWTINKAPATSAAQQGALFGFDYSAFGIPPAPGGDGTDTHGMRLRANVPGSDAAPVPGTRPAGTASGLSVSPTGKNFGTNYQVQFYAWSNFFGAANANGLADNGASEGGTNNVMFAIGTSGAVPVVVTNTTGSGLATGASMDGIGFATTGDGGLGNDWRVFAKSGTFVPATTAGVYAANSATATSNADAFYTALFPAQSAPSGQQAIADADFFDTNGFVMGGMTQAGVFGFAWHKVVLAKNGNSVTWTIDDNLIATVDASTLGALGGNNIALGVSDVNATTAKYPSLEFTVFDNLTVSSLAAPGVQGDYNGNGVVDMADYVLWRNGGPLQNEVNSVGTVDSTDYDAWRARFGNTSGSGSGLASAAVPEPSSLLLLVIGAACCGGRFNRKRS